MLIVDAHLDMAHNALKYDRDQLLPVAQIRASEGRNSGYGLATVSFPALREAGVGIVFATLFALPTGSADIVGGDTRMSYEDRRTAFRLAIDQLDYYHRLVDDPANRLRLVTDQASLQEVLNSQGPDDEEALIGIVPLMEGAEPIQDPAQVEMWAERGLRAVGLAWDNTCYAAGAWRDNGQGLTREGRELLDAMASQHLILDLSHMSEKACWQSLEQYEGPIVATHCNARTLVPGMRQLDDNQIGAVGERDGVIGVVLYNRFLRAGHRNGDPKERVTIDFVIAHIDHMCQLLGDAEHVGIGSDMDGGFGAEDIPAEMDNVSDLPLIATHLRQKGYEEQDIVNIMGGNWLRILKNSLQS